MPQFDPNTSSSSAENNPIIIQQVERKTNGVGIAGFILSLIAIFVGWIPVLGWFVWFLGLILSFVGVFNKPRGLAIAGLVISLIGVIILVFLFGVVLFATGVGSLAML